MKRTRFAPSPTGPLHLGHAYAALIAAERADPGEFLLRIEDLDRERSRPHWEAQIFDDLHWLGLRWPEPVLRQSSRQEAYDAALDRLIALGLCYPCSCTRADIRAATSAPQEGVPAQGPDGTIYPGTCRQRSMATAKATDAIRLDMSKSFKALSGNANAFCEYGPAHSGVHILTEDRLATSIGDVVLSRKSGGAAYHLAVVVDDAAQGITEVTRGEDLFEATFIHVVLQNLLNLDTPSYFHHELIRDEAGKRLAKRDDARALALYRAEGAAPQEIRRLIGLQA
ncbi:tRNA glutamyl-Q(34) synthetase GluQRS [Frigidibacter sp. MR17.14]|uniref:tRNA glutamyl-Q(34) synthetase GluQRS n=1 Tax=Frigidibacter sp. MR17.14 TaxID=3126509 RepID=UPI003012FA57